MGKKYITVRKDISMMLVDFQALLKQAYVFYEMATSWKKTTVLVQDVLKFKIFVFYWKNIPFI